MKLVEEKKALSEISNLKKIRKTVEALAAQQDVITAEKAAIEQIKNDPQAKAINEKLDKVQVELDAINKIYDEASKGRDGLYNESRAISQEIDDLYTKKKEAMSIYREANNKWCTSVRSRSFALAHPMGYVDQQQQDTRARRYERERGERNAVAETKKAELNERLLEEAQAPAFEREIEDCRTLIEYFQRRIGAPVSGATTPLALSTNGDSLGLPKLEARVVEALPAGATVLKKKGEDEEFFMGGGGKKGKKGPRKVDDATTKKDESLNLPFGTLSALLSMGIESPILVSQIQKTIEALESKRKYFVDNQVSLLLFLVALRRRLTVR